MEAEKNEADMTVMQKIVRSVQKVKIRAANVMPLKKLTEFQFIPASSIAHLNHDYYRYSTFLTVVIQCT